MNSYNAYQYGGNVSAKRNRSAAQTAMRFMRAFLDVLSERVVSLDLHAVATAISFIVVLGFIGGMECGSIPLYAGIPVCAIVAFAGLYAHFED